MPGSAEEARGSPGLKRHPGRGAPGRIPGARTVARALACAAVLAAAACSIEEGPAAAQEPAEQIPDTIAIGLVHRVHQDGRLSLELTAARAETWNATKQTILSDARFVQFDDTGAPATEGQAARVVFHSDTENAEVSGGVRVRSESEKGSVRADSLSWDNKAKLLSAPPQEVITLRKDDGSVLSGSGFQGDFRTRELTFSGPVRGTYVQADQQQ